MINQPPVRICLIKLMPSAAHAPSITELENTGCSKEPSTILTRGLDSQLEDERESKLTQRSQEVIETENHQHHVYPTSQM